MKMFEQARDFDSYRKMVYAFNCMRWGRIDGARSFKFNSRLYEQLKTKYAKIRVEYMNNNNPMSNKEWICNFDTEESMIHDASETIPDGWVKGRHSKEWFKKFKNRQNEKSKILSEKLQKIRDMYDEFVKNEFDGVVKKFGYCKTRNNLIMLFKKYILII